MLTGLPAFAGLVMLMVGLCYYALAKGYSKWLGLLGLLSRIGLIVLACLPDRTKATTFTGQRSSFEQQVQSYAEFWRRRSESDQFRRNYSSKMPDFIENFNENRVTEVNSF